MINNDTNNNNNNNTFNNHNNTSNNDVRIPTTTTTTTTPSSTKRRRTRLPSTFSFRKLLIYIRVLILALALVSLILDAITISFQTNVMNLGYEDVSRQAFLILTPDLLAIGMIVFLFVYPSSLCCGSGTGGSERGVIVEEEYYDYDNEEEEEEEEEEGSQTRNGAGGGGGASSVTATAPTVVVAATGEGVGGAGNTRMATARSQAQQQQQQQQQQGTPSLSPATYNNYDNDEEEDSLHRRRPYHHQHQNTGLPLHSHQQPLPLYSTSHSHHKTTNLASGTTPTTTTNNGRQQLLHSQDHDRITTTTSDTAATTLSSPSIAFPHSAKSTGAGTGTGETEKHFQEQQQPSTSPPGGASLAEMIAQEEMDETSRKRRRARLYTIARVVFSLGLTILALYWPAGQFKPNLAGSVGTPAAPVVGGEHEQPSVHGNGSMSFDHIPRSYLPPPSSTKEALPTLTSVTITTPTSMPTPTTSNIFGSTPGVSSTNSNNVASTSNGTTIFAPSSISNFSTKDYYIGGRHNRKGRQKDQHGCTDEESYGDDDSATVYCRSRLIRPIVTYIWSVFLVVELCIAALAGDFSKHGIRRRKYRDFGDDDDVHFDGDGLERDLEKEEHVQSVQSLAVSESLGTGTGAIAHQHQQQQQQRQR